MAMHNPAHPGEVIRALCLTPLGLTVTAGAEALGVTRKTLSDLLNGHSGVSPEMAIRLEKVAAGWVNRPTLSAAMRSWSASGRSVVMTEIRDLRARPTTS